MATATKTPAKTSPKAKALKATKANMKAAAKATAQKQRTCRAGTPTWLPDADRCDRPTIRPAAALCAEHEEQWKAAGGRKELQRLRALVAVQREKARDAKAAKELAIEKAKADHSKDRPTHASPALKAKADAKRAAAKAAR